MGFIHKTSVMSLANNNQGKTRLLTEDSADILARFELLYRRIDECEAIITQDRGKDRYKLVLGCYLLFIYVIYLFLTVFSGDFTIYR